MDWFFASFFWGIQDAMLSHRWAMLPYDGGFDDPGRATRGYFAVMVVAAAATSLLAVGLALATPIILQLFLIGALLFSYVLSFMQYQAGGNPSQAFKLTVEEKAEETKPMQRTEKNIASVVEVLGEENDNAPASTSVASGIDINVSTTAPENKAAEPQPEQKQ